jgi:hypothetical protein
VDIIIVRIWIYDKQRLPHYNSANDAKKTKTKQNPNFLAMQYAGFNEGSCPICEFRTQAHYLHHDREKGRGGEQLSKQITKLGTLYVMEGGDPLHIVVCSTKAPEQVGSHIRSDNLRR